MRPIDADALIVEIKTCLWDWESVNGIMAKTVLNQTITDIGNMPTIDAVPVVRCKDCKYSHPWYADRRTCELWTETGVDVFNDGFCSYGERKDNE